MLADTYARQDPKEDARRGGLGEQARREGDERPAAWLKDADSHTGSTYRVAEPIVVMGSPVVL